MNILSLNVFVSAYHVCVAALMLYVIDLFF